MGKEIIEIVGKSINKIRIKIKFCFDDNSYYICMDRNLYIRTIEIYLVKFIQKLQIRKFIK